MTDKRNRYSDDDLVEAVMNDSAYEAHLWQEIVEEARELEKDDDDEND